MALVSINEARDLAEQHLAGPLPRRWAHTQGVAATARRIRPILGDDADLIEAAAWLHDIGYAPDLAETGFHPLDGARHLRATGAGSAICNLVAYHTGAVYEASERGLEHELTSEFTPPPEHLSDALTYSDITTSPDGEPVEVTQRIAEILQRYEPEHPVHRTIRNAGSLYVDSVKRVEKSLENAERAH